MNKKLGPGFLLDVNGNLAEKGYSLTMTKEYHREQITAPKHRIKEWDYYYVGDDTYGLALTIDDNGYMGLVSCSILGFKNDIAVNQANMFPFPMGNVKMPKSSKNGDVSKKGKHYSATFVNNNGNRTLYYKNDNIMGKPFECRIALKETTPYSLTIATPFKKDKCFYYNQKINNLKASGTFTWGDFHYEFSDKAYGCLDWGRGVWTYKNTWYWSSMSGEYQGNKIGFNLGYGFGDTSAASENILYFNKEVFKLDDVEFEIPKLKNGKEDYLSMWRIISKNKDIDLTFDPILDRHDKSNALIIMQDAHQVFGKFNGTFTIGERKIHIKDMIGFAEKVKNRW